MIEFLKNIYRLLRVNYWNFRILHEADNRKKLSIFQYTELAEPFEIKYHPFSLFDFNYYGIGRCLSKRFNLDNSCVEHGIVLGSFVQKHLVKSPEFKRLFTFSDYRENYIRAENSSIEIVKVGPYIAYANRLYSDEYFAEIKEELGRVLLVFPEHTLMEIDFNFEFNEFIERVKAKGAEYDTVLICGYWADILKGNIDLYEKYNFKIVCAGHNLDPYFLNRLRFIIELSDTVFTNSIGTHIGYSVFLSKHLIIYQQSFQRFLLDANSKELAARNSQDNLSLDAVREEIYNLFNNSYNEDFNSDEQVQYISKLFGFQYVSS